MKKYDIVVVGAGVGGRAMSIRGEEILSNGSAWYTRLLAKQYSWLPYSEPGLDEIISRRLLQCYT